MSVDIAFPALAVSPENSFIVIDEAPTLCNYLGWRKGYYNGLLLYDSIGRLWRVARSTPTKPPGLLTRLLNRRMEVQLDYDEPVSDGLSEVSELVAQLIDDDPDDLYDRFVTHDELKSMFRAAKTPADFIGLAKNLGGIG